ncbi:MAG: hypothetical protein AAFQ57_07885 [Cyanobacteria bacterium J06626_14]
MGMSLYYTARRSTPLAADSSAAISQIETEYKAKIEEFANDGIGDYWESFCIYDAADPSEPNVNLRRRNRASRQFQGSDMSGSSALVRSNYPDPP